jgi:hypothetical protein
MEITQMIEDLFGDNADDDGETDLNPPAGLIVAEAVTNTEELRLTEDMIRSAGAANLCIFIEGGENGEPEIFMNQLAFQRSMGLDRLPSISEASQWKLKVQEEVFELYRERLAAAAAKGPDR